MLKKRLHSERARNSTQEVMIIHIDRLEVSFAQWRGPRQKIDQSQQNDRKKCGEIFRVPLFPTAQKKSTTKPAATACVIKQLTEQAGDIIGRILDFYTRFLTTVSVGSNFLATPSPQRLLTTKKVVGGALSWTNLVLQPWSVRKVH